MEVDNYLYSTTRNIQKGEITIDVHYSVLDKDSEDISIYIHTLHSNKPVGSVELLEIRSNIEDELYRYHVITRD